MKKIVSSTVVSASILLLVFTGISRSLGFIREVVFASNFGLGTQYDTYLIASAIPITINTIFLYIGQNFFIPNFIELKFKDKQAIDTLLNLSLFYFFILGSIISFLLYFFAPSILFIFNIYEKKSVELGVQLLRILVFTIPLNGLISILSALLQAEKKYILPALSSLLLNLMVLVVVIFINNKLGVVSIVIGYLIGTVVQLTFLLLNTKTIKTILNQANLKLTKQLKLVNTSIILIIIIEFISQLYIISDRLFISQVKPGGVAAINYAQNIITLPISIITMSLSTAIFPKFSTDYHSGFKEDLAKGFNHAIEITLLIFVPISILFHFMSTEIINLFYQRGAFTSNDTKMTSEVFLILNLGLVIYAIYSIFNKIFYSAKLVYILFSITLTGIVLKIASNFLFVNYFDFEGLAVGTVLSYIFFFFCSLWVLSKKFKFIKIKTNVLYFFILLTNGLLSIFITRLIIPGFSNILWINTFIKSSVFISIFMLNLYLINFQILITLFERLKKFRRLLFF